MSSIKSIFLACIPLYGDGVRFRAYLRLREYFRKKNNVIMGTMLKALILHKYGCEISIKARISPKVKFMHTVGVVIGEGVMIGEGTVIYSNVCLGRKNIYDEYDYPSIGENVQLCTGAKVLGKIKVGNHAVIGANSLVLSDCAEGGGICWISC